jgi:hypothetical protein
VDCGDGGGPALQYALHMCTSVHDVIQAFATVSPVGVHVNGSETHSAVWGFRPSLLGPSRRVRRLRISSLPHEPRSSLKTHIRRDPISLSTPRPLGGQPAHLKLLWVVRGGPAAARAPRPPHPGTQDHHLSTSNATSYVRRSAKDLPRTMAWRLQLVTTSDRVTPIWIVE